MNPLLAHSAPHLLCGFFLCYQSEVLAPPSPDPFHFLLSHPCLVCYVTPPPLYEPHFTVQFTPSVHLYQEECVPSCASMQ